jgi:hypothetical protein
LFALGELMLVCIRRHCARGVARDEQHPALDLDNNSLGGILPAIDAGIAALIF